MLRLRWFLGSSLLALVACGGSPEHPAPVGDDPVATAPPGDLGLSPASDADACVGSDAPSAALPVDLFAVVDGSSSMQEATFTGVSKWYATKSAFHDFLAHAPAGVGFGLSLFPVPGEETASCVPQHYLDAALPINAASDMADGVLARLEAVKPAGQTPTGPALTAALALATAHAELHRDRSVIVVLATDGLPTTCAPVETAALAKLAEHALHGPGHVRTLVVASQSLAGSDQHGFEAIAAAGGTGRPLNIDPHADFAQQLSQALGAAAGQQVACDLALPEPPAQQHLDYDAVNVTLQTGEQRLTFPRVGGPEDCSAAGGWYYDVDPEKGAPNRLNMCKSSCDRLGETGGSSLRVELGCKTRVR